MGPSWGTPAFCGALRAALDELDAGLEELERRREHLPALRRHLLRLLALRLRRLPGAPGVPQLQEGRGDLRAAGAGVTKLLNDAALGASVANVFWSLDREPAPV